MLILKEIAESMKLENPAQDVPIPFSFPGIVSSFQSSQDEFEKHIL